MTTSSLRKVDLYIKTVIFVYFSDLLSEIDKMCEEYMEKIRKLTPPEKKDYLNRIDSAFRKSREYGDDKVQLAIQTYEMV